MRQETIERLLALNQEFYQSFAEPFSETRGRVQPGVLRAIDGFPKNASVLDVGCGNGTLARKLAELGHRGIYVGLDSTQELLVIARENCKHPHANFLERDITKIHWDSSLPGPFDAIVAFAVIHHLPGKTLRTEIFRAFNRLLHSEGMLIFSLWNFLASPRLRARIIPWDRMDLRPEDLDPGDYLLDWRRGGKGVRYVHVFEPEELRKLAGETGFTVLETYSSDGEGGKLGHYQIWKLAQRPAL